MVTTVPVLGAILMAACMMSVTRGDLQSVAVDKMNYYRDRVSPPATDMNQLVYDSRLADIASAYVQQCKWGHNPSRSRNYPGYVGENMYATTGTKTNEQLVLDAIKSWNDEKAYYDYRTNSCRRGKVCGHYTQLVWASTRKVGCAVKKCRRATGLPSSFSPVSIVVCNYSPGGNYRGVKPYTSAASAMVFAVENGSVRHPTTLAIMSVVVFLVASAVAARWWTKTKGRNDVDVIDGDERVPLY